MKLNAGLRLRSQVDDTEVIVIRPPNSEVTLGCGGFDLVPIDAQPTAHLQAKNGWMSGTTLGKRYTAEQDGALEVLVTRAGNATLSADDRPLVIREAKPLPASD